MEWVGKQPQRWTSICERFVRESSWMPETSHAQISHSLSMASAAGEIPQGGWLAVAMSNRRFYSNLSRATPVDPGECSGMQLPNGAGQANRLRRPPVRFDSWLLQAQFSLQGVDDNIFRDMIQSYWSIISSPWFACAVNPETAVDLTLQPLPLRTPRDKPSFFRNNYRAPGTLYPASQNLEKH